MHSYHEGHGHTAVVSPASVPSEHDLIGLSAEAMARLLVDLAHSNPLLANQLSRRLEALPLASAASRAKTAEPDGPLLLGDSAAMRRVNKEIQQYATTDAAVLITGETGTGKELAAAAVHRRSLCAKGPFVAVNCAGLPASLVSSELFGHEKGAFTGAHQRKVGRIEAARGGTVFLDEIGDFPFELQAHLLRFLQEKTIERVGACRPVEVDVRVIAATNKDLASEVRDGRFREDLFYRLHVLRLHLPPLRDREDDIELLSEHYLREFRSAGPGRSVRFSAEAIRALRAHPWPGNVRELMGRVRRAAVTSDGPLIQPSDLGFARIERRQRERGRVELRGAGTVALHLAGAADATADATVVGRPETEADSAAGSLALSFVPGARHPTLAAAKRELEAWLLSATLRAARNNVTLAAERLGVSRVTLYRLLDRNGLRESHLAIADGD